MPEQRRSEATERSCTIAMWRVCRGCDVERRHEHPGGAHSPRPKFRVSVPRALARAPVKTSSQNSPEVLDQHEVGVPCPAAIQ